MTHLLSLQRVVLLVATLLFFGVASALHAQTFTTFDPPNSTHTIATAINAQGQITGYYSDGTGTGGPHGFLRKRDGTFVTFDAFIGGPSSFPSNAYPMDINAAGQIVGYYMYYPGEVDGFLRQTDGTIIHFGLPWSLLTNFAAIDQGPYKFCLAFSQANAINALGQITGVYFTGFHCYGFLRQPNGTITSFDANTQPYDPICCGAYTEPQAINLLGQITGRYHGTDSSTFRGFLRQPNGKIVRFTPPDSVNTTPKAINVLGQIAGYYQDTNSVVHGFLRKPSGHIVTFDPTGSTETTVTAINDLGQITGYHFDGNAYHGFVRKWNGAITTFDAPGAATGIEGGTFPQDINLTGQITGYFQDANFVVHGFVRSPR